MQTLLEFYSKLNNEQQEAVDLIVKHKLNTIVKAGPGSGKTRIVCVTAGFLNNKGLGTVCISYSNSSVEILRTWLNKISIFESKNLFIGTVHDFCLSHIIYKFGSLFQSDLSNFGIASQIQITEIAQSLHTTSNNIQKYRREFLGNGTIQKEQFQLIRMYDDLMKHENLMDFEMIVEKAIEIIEKNNLIKQYLLNNFPYFIIDEYQDLGGGLHKLIKVLSELGICILAVGDANQLIYDFQGAKDEYLDELEKELNYKPVSTKICYRFNNKIIKQSLQILDQSVSGIKALPDAYNGKIYPVFDVNNSKGWLAEKKFLFEYMLHKIVKSNEINTLSEIGILCRKWESANEIAAYFDDKTLNADKIEAHVERDLLVSRNPIVQWIGDLTKFVIFNKDVHIKNGFSDILGIYTQLLENYGIKLSTNENLEVEYKLVNFLSQSVAHDINFLDWVNYLDQKLNFSELLSQIPNRRGDLLELNALKTNSEIRTKSISKLFFNNSDNKITITTMHSAKGREFKYVILPRISNSFFQSSEDPLSHRRLFYVACTRAMKYTYVLISESKNKTSTILQRLATEDKVAEPQN